MRAMVSGVAVCAFFAAASVAYAAPTIVEFPLPPGSQPLELTAGPDGNLWVAEFSAITRVTPAGEATTYGLPGTPANQGIVSGPDGRLWFAMFNDSSHFGRIGTDGMFANVNYAPNGQIGDFALGPDGNMYAAVSFQTPRVTKFSPTGVKLLDVNAPANRRPRRIVSGPGGALWFVEQGDGGGETDGVVRMATNGARQLFPFSSSQSLRGIAVGPDANLWIAGSVQGGVTFAARMAPDGGRTLFEVAPEADAGPITAGPDGNLWTTLHDRGEIARITPSGAVDRYPLPTQDSRPADVAVGPGDGNLWVLERPAFPAAARLARVTPGPDAAPGGGTTTGGGGTPEIVPTPLAPPDLDAPAVTGVRADPARFAVGGAATATTGVAARVAKGTTLRYTLSEQASAVLRIERRAPGRRIRGTCRKPPRGGKRNGARCSRFVRAGTLTRASHPGANAVAFSGRIGRRALRVGRYRVLISATDAAGNVTARSPSSGFTIVRARTR
jgi:virginiamycin B lyase